MGPVLIFDKSTLQSLSFDEAVWFEQFFMFNITPIFFIETLADLSKQTARRRPEDVVGDLARKTPVLEAFPNFFHHALVGNSLVRNEPPMNGQVVVVGGVPKRSPDGKIGEHFDESDEAAALARWQGGQFHELERGIAQTWRTTLTNVDFKSMMREAMEVTGGQRARSLDDAKDLASKVTERTGIDTVRFAVRFLGLDHFWESEVERLYPVDEETSLKKYAPYAAHVLEVSLFFYVAMASSLIARERPSNMVDIAYLYYLPFCQVFVSNDKLHQKTTPYFLGAKQRFLEGKALKAALREMVEFYEGHMEEIEEMGVIRFAPRPPAELDNAITTMWDDFLPGWREAPAHYDPDRERSAKPGAMTADDLKGVAEESVPVGARPPGVEPDYSMFMRKIPVRRGRWRLAPPEAEASAEGD